ncbi:hypothetical protein [Pontivivens nitratireducens]|uniref:hypothetical protein n=1 Tax=Pontivivens nitratireducens TaxID=2758038 RepID=UPI001F1188EF|nr:hypothetical protein [Pontibrevibacter nitratireducens]
MIERNHPDLSIGHQFSGGSAQTLIVTGLVPLGFPVWSAPNSDRPDTCLSLDLSTDRERLAVRRCLEDAARPNVEGVALDLV